MTYRHYLREWRAERGLDREELAAMVDTSASTIAGFENGERHMKLDMQPELMAALHVSPRQFFSQPPRDPGMFDWSGLRGAVLRPLLRTGAWLFRQ